MELTKKLEYMVRTFHNINKNTNIIKRYLIFLERIGK